MRRHLSVLLLGAASIAACGSDGGTAEDEAADSPELRSAKYRDLYIVASVIAIGEKGQQGFAAMVAEAKDQDGVSTKFAGVGHFGLTCQHETRPIDSASCEITGIVRSSTKPTDQTFTIGGRIAKAIQAASPNGPAICKTTGSATTCTMHSGVVGYQSVAQLVRDNPKATREEKAELDEGVKASF